MSLFDDNPELYNTQHYTPETDSEHSSSDEEPPEKKKRGENREYAFMRHFDTKDEFLAWWQGEGEDGDGERKKWRILQRHDNKTNESEYWRCMYAKRSNYDCKKVLRIDFAGEDESILIFESINEHDDEPLEKEPLSSETKKAILELMETGLPPLRILNALRNRKVDPLPSLLQVQNVCKRARQVDGGGRIFTVHELRQYCDDNSAVPEDENETYVVHHDVESDKRFCVVWSTEKLMKKHVKQEFIQVDSTYKLTWNGFPVQMVGFSDASKRFHPTALCVAYSEDTWTYTQLLMTLRTKGVRAKVILGDGAKEISAAARDTYASARRAMCWAHVSRQVDKRLVGFPKELRSRLREELHMLQFCRTDEEFTTGVIGDCCSGMK